MKLNVQGKGNIPLLQSPSSPSSLPSYIASSVVPLTGHGYMYTRCGQGRDKRATCTASTFVPHTRCPAMHGEDRVDQDTGIADGTFLCAFACVRNLSTIGPSWLEY